jgi:hypothetical protein
VLENSETSEKKCGASPVGSSSIPCWAWGKSLLLKAISKRGEIKLYKGDGSFIISDLLTCGYSIL